MSSLIGQVTDSSLLPNDREWVDEAVHRIEADFARSSDTHLIKLDLPCLASAGIDLYLKDELTHPSGSLKHRLARSLFLYALCNGWIRRGTTVVEASSGSTAISEAYFARLLGLQFIAVAPEATAQPKVEAIEFLGGEVRLTAPSAIYDEAIKIAASSGGHYMDQFTFAERATDWRGNNNIAESSILTDAAGALSGAGLGRSQRRNWRHILDDRTIHSISTKCAQRDTTLRSRSGDSVFTIIFAQVSAICTFPRARA